MDDKLLIATGWYSDKQCWRKYADRARRTFEANWLRDWWQPYIERFVKPDHYFCYVSNCEVMPCEDTFSHGNWDYVVGHYDARQLDHRHGFHASLMMSLQYAYCEGMDWLYIEQDCLVYNLKEVISWARINVNNKLIVYGWEPWTMNQGWAEQSLMFVPYLAIPSVLWIMNKAMVHTNCVGIPEKTWHGLFQNCFIGWPFGYGRNKVTDWEGEMFFKQQVSDSEIERFWQLNMDYPL